ncbi:MAG: hypothetical protein IH820_08030 [Bacteroidetes bacterium]|nr:hypothetical protein [Bacteroidota bacterium]
MSFQYQGGAIQGNHMTVFDLDKQAVRKIDLSMVQPGVVVLKQAKRTFEEVRQELHDLLF